MTKNQTANKRYNRIKLVISIFSLILDFMLWLLVLFLLSEPLANYAYRLTAHPLIQFYIFSGILGIGFSLIHFPISFYSGYLLEHQFSLSNQSIWDWIVEKLKGLAVSLILGTIILTVFYLLLWQYPRMWWLGIWLFILLFSILLSLLTPLILFPIFYKFKPLENVSLKDRIQKFATKWKIPIAGVYQFDLSKNTKKANAAFAGLGKSRRIILGDTLINNFSEDEIETVFAHEVGHYRHRHLVKGILINSLISLTGLFLVFHIYQFYLLSHQFVNHQLEAIPFLALLMVIYGLISSPLGNMISRKFEYQADQFAVFSTKGQEFFKNSLKKLSQLNLADETPHPLVEFLFYSHPSIQKRINKISEVNQ
jgi:STE24 endopeptidase